MAYRRVEVGALHGELKEVKSGLSEKDRIVVEGLQRVRPGITVQPTEAKPTPKDVKPTPKDVKATK